MFGSKFSQTGICPSEGYMENIHVSGISQMFRIKDAKQFHKLSRTATDRIAIPDNNQFG